MFENIHWPSILFSVLIAAIILFIFYSRKQMTKSVKKLPEDEFINVMRKGQLIDIRKKVEFDEGHINGSRNIPLALLSKSVSRLRGDQPIYLVCADGKQALRAGLLLQSKNFTQIYALDGGIKSWSKPLKTKK